MNNLTKKILESGLVDKATAKMLGRWGVIDETASDLVKEDALKLATREELLDFAEAIEEEIEKRRKMRESMLDLNQLRWPASVSIEYGSCEAVLPSRTDFINAVVDRMGRYYFRPQDVPEGMLVPGHRIRTGTTRSETILEVTELFVGDQVVAIQVSVTKP